MSGEGGRRCAWCEAVTDDAAATTCDGCGAVLAQREDLGGIVIPGVTGVDPALEGLDGPMRIPGASPTQGLAGGVAVAAAMGGPVALAALGGLAAVAATEYLGAKRVGGGDAPDAAHVGEPSALARQALARLRATEAGADPTPPSHPWGDLPENRDAEV